MQLITEKVKLCITSLMVSTTPHSIKDFHKNLNFVDVNFQKYKDNFQTKLYTKQQFCEGEMFLQTFDY